MSHLSDEKPPSESEAPSTAAWSMHEIASTDGKSKAAFLEKIYAKIINKEKPSEGGHAFADDKRKFFALFSALETERPDLLNESFPRTPVVVPEQPIGPEEVGVLPSADGGSAEDTASLGCQVG